MNKTTTVNIAGFVFNIEEEAFEELKKYLDGIRNNFSDDGERDEIMADIERRIAELFQEKNGTRKEVIVQEDIDEIMEILGHPEDFASDDEDAQPNPEQTKNAESAKTSGHKRLFRDKDNATIGGVCAGLGHYFETDPLIFRILFILLFVLFGSGILLYIILLLVVPEAKTTSDKIEMKGQFVNVESIKEHIANIKQSISDSTNRSQIRDNIKGAVDRSVKTGHSIFQTLSKILGVGFLIGGTFLFIFLMLIFFGDTGIIPFIGPDRIANFSTLIEIIYPGENPSSLIFISVIAVSIIPVISLILTGIRMLFSYKENAKKIAWSLGIIWIIAASTLFFFSVRLATDFKSEKEIVYDMKLNTFSSQELMIDVSNDDVFSNHIDPYEVWGSSELIKADPISIYFGLSEVRILSTLDTGDFKISLIKQSRGETTRDAIHKIERIDYDLGISGNNVFIPPYLKIPRLDKMRGQYVVVEIFVPNGKTVKFGNNIDRVWRYIEGQPHPWDAKYANTKWTNLNGILTKSGYTTENEPANY